MTFVKTDVLNLIVACLCFVSWPLMELMGRECVKC